MSKMRGFRRGITFMFLLLLMVITYTCLILINLRIDNCNTTDVVERELLTNNSLFGHNQVPIITYNKATPNYSVSIDRSDKTDSSKKINSFANNDSSEKTFTFMEFKERTQSDSQFFRKILNQNYLHPKTKDVLSRYFLGTNYSFENEFKEKFKDTLKSNYDVMTDVMVFLHIQKTGGMHLNDRFSSELQIPFKCNCGAKVKPCTCLNPRGNMWIYTAVFSGWPCGLHADWTQLHRCIPGQIDQMEGNSRDRRYFYFTQLRDPVDRYLSEYNHNTRIGHWQDAILGCGKGYSDWRDIRPCFHTDSWVGVTLDNFMACPHNLATNRMTRMLADLTLSDCYRKFLDTRSRLSRAIKWVESAKDNLQKMEYFGLMEDTAASDKMFSNIFNINYRHIKTKEHKRTFNSINRMKEEQFLKLLKLAELDIHIHLFAKDLFYKRLNNL